MKDVLSSRSMNQTFNLSSKPKLNVDVIKGTVELGSGFKNSARKKSLHNQNSKTHNVHVSSAKSQKVQPFDQFDSAANFIAVVPRMSTNSFQPIGTPQHLKKMSQVNTSMERYLQKTTYATDRVSVKSLDNKR